MIGDPHLRFYAGALLETEEGLPLGTICVLDYKPRQLTDNQKDLLRLMASQIMKLFELRRRNMIKKTQFPYKTLTGAMFDSGDFHGLVAKAKEEADDTAPNTIAQIG